MRFGPMAAYSSRRRCDEAPGFIADARGAATTLKQAREFCAGDVVNAPDRSSNLHLNK